MEKIMADSEKILFSVDVGSDNRIVCFKTEYKGKNYLGIRQQYLDAEADEWKFTKKGVNIKYDNGKAEEFIKKFKKAFKKDKKSK